MSPKRTLILTQNDSRMISLAQIKEFAKVSQNIEFRGASRKEKCEWYDVYLTPYEALRTHLNPVRNRVSNGVNASKFLKEGLTIEQLDKISKERSDNEFAASMQRAKAELFKSFNQKLRFI